MTTMEYVYTVLLSWISTCYFYLAISFFRSLSLYFQYELSTGSSRGIVRQEKTSKKVDSEIKVASRNQVLDPNSLQILR